MINCTWQEDCMRSDLCSKKPGLPLKVIPQYCIAHHTALDFRVICARKRARVLMLREKTLVFRTLSCDHFAFVVSQSYGELLDSFCFQFRFASCLSCFSGFFSLPQGSNTDERSTLLVCDNVQHRSLRCH